MSETTTALERLYKLPPTLAKPVARGHLPLPQAQAGLRASTYRVHREGSLEALDPEHVYAGLRHLLAVWIEREELARDRVRGQIRRMLLPLIDSRKPSNALLAEAHNANGEAGFLLSEREVAEAVTTQVYWALPSAKAARGLHG